MPGTEITLPANFASTSGIDIYQGTAWYGCALQYKDSAGNPLPLDLVAYVMTDSLNNNGSQLAQCETPGFAGRWRVVYLSPYETSRLPARQLFVEVKGRLNADLPYATLAILQPRVHAQFTDTTPDTPPPPLYSNED